jgi:hypothetical protein
VSHLDRNGHVSTQRLLGGGGLNNLIAARRAPWPGTSVFSTIGRTPSARDASLFPLNLQQSRL